MATFKKAIQYAIGVPLVGLTLIGSCTNHKNDFPPFYLNKTGTSAGIALACAVYVEKDAKFSGLAASLKNKNRGTVNGVTLSLFDQNHGTVNGARLSGINENSRTVNGVNLGIVNVSIASNTCINGLEASFANFYSASSNCVATKLNGVQFGLGNFSREKSKGLQLGVYNEGYSADGTETMSIGLNVAGYK